MTEVYVGIDLGLSGAISILREDGSIKVMDIPTREVSFMKNDKPKVRREIEEVDLIKMLYTELAGVTGTIHVCMERVSSRPKEGTTSAFRFGEVTGTVKSAVVALKVLSGLDVKWYKVFPSVWKRTFDLIGTDKNVSLELARTKYPSMATTFLKRKKDHNRGDAILLAEYIKTHKPESIEDDDAEDE
jgi:hypothetical protein